MESLTTEYMASPLDVVANRKSVSSVPGFRVIKHRRCVRRKVNYNIKTGKVVGGYGLGAFVIIGDRKLARIIIGQKSQRIAYRISGRCHVFILNIFGNGFIIFIIEAFAGIINRILKNNYALGRNKLVEGHHGFLVGWCTIFTGNGFLIAAVGRIFVPAGCAGADGVWLPQAASITIITIIKALKLIFSFNPSLIFLN
jgi:hypothetical protein